MRSDHKNRESDIGNNIGQSTRKSANKTPIKNIVGRAFKSITGIGKGNYSSNFSEQTSLLQQDIEQASTSDTSATHKTASSTVVAAVNDPYPRSKDRLHQKWGHIKDQFSLRTMAATEQTALMMNTRGVFDKEDREAMVQEAQEKIRGMMTFNVKHCILAIVVYIGISILCFSYWLEDWTVIDSIYFAVVTFTTIGYGDVTPDTPTSRIFTCFWSCSGVACLGVALGILGSNLVDTSQQGAKQSKEKHRDDVIGMFNIDNVPRQSKWSNLERLEVDNNYMEDPFPAANDKCKSCMTNPKTSRFALLFAIIGVLLYGLSQTEDWNLFMTIYYGLITASTVGYGDLSPHTQIGRVLAILYIPVAVCLMALFLDSISNAIIESRQLQAEQQLKSKELTLNDLKVMDADGDGTVTKAEFLEFMLVAMDQVEQDVIDHLKDRFDRLDLDKSGALDKADLIHVANYNLKKEKSRRHGLGGV